MSKFLALILSLLFSTDLLAKTIYIVPVRHHDIEGLFYSYGSRDECSKVFFCMREELEKMGYEVKYTWDGKNLGDFTALISLTETSSELLANLIFYPKERCWLFVFEPPVILPHIYHPFMTAHFGKIFVMLDNFVDNKNYFKFFYPQPRFKMIEDVPDFTHKKFSTLISCNKDADHPLSLYGERRNVITFFAKLAPGEFDLYGHGWEGYRDWKGTVPHKWEVLKNYKFAFCYENMKEQTGYISEKIFDCFVGGCVPIYWGASNISDNIPKECFIDRRDFASQYELYHFLKKMDEKTYKNYIENIKIYLSSPEAQLYSIDNFLKIIKDNLAELEY